MRHSSPETKRHYQLGMVDQVREGIERANERAYQDKEVLRSYYGAAKAVSGGMSVVHCGGPGAAGPPALDGGGVELAKQEVVSG